MPRYCAIGVPKLQSMQEHIYDFVMAISVLEQVTGSAIPALIFAG
jgi:hypothetical protein